MANVSFASMLAGSQIATASATLTVGNQLPRAQTTYFPLSTISSLVHPRDGMLARSRGPTTVTTRPRHVSSRRVEAVRTCVHARERIVDDRVLQRIVDGTIAFFRGAIYSSGIISLSPKRKRFRRGVPLLGLWRTSLLLLLLLRGELKQSWIYLSFSSQVLFLFLLLGKRSREGTFQVQYLRTLERFNLVVVVIIIQLEIYINRCRYQSCSRNDSHCWCFPLFDTRIFISALSQYWHGYSKDFISRPPTGPVEYLSNPSVWQQGEVWHKARNLCEPRAEDAESIRSGRKMTRMVGSRDISQIILNGSKLLETYQGSLWE